MKSSQYGQNNLQRPDIPYLETITRSATAKGKHKKLVDGVGQFGVVKIRLDPVYDHTASLEFSNAVVGGVVPSVFVPAVVRGLREACAHGPLAGYPVVGIRATLTDGKYHPVDSKEIAFISAAKQAFQAACEDAKPVILEPVQSVRVYVPTEYCAEVCSDLSQRRARLLGTVPNDEEIEITAEVPMREMAEFESSLAERTQGQGWTTQEFCRYEELPDYLVHEVAAEAEAGWRDEED